MQTHYKFTYKCKSIFTTLSNDLAIKWLELLNDFEQSDFVDNFANFTGV